MMRKEYFMKTILAVMLLSGILTHSHGKDNKDNSTLSWNVRMTGQGSTGSNMPFWSYANKNGIIPEHSGGTMTGGVYYTAQLKHGFRANAGIGLAGYAAAAQGKAEWKGIIDQLYGGIGWKKLDLDLGIKHRSLEFNVLSLTGGDITWTGNSQSLPGYMIHSDWINVPGTKEILALQFSFGDFAMWDKRVVRHTLAHNESLYLKIKPYRKFAMSFGVELWTQWNGTSPTLGRQPNSFKDYLRVIICAKGGETATESDQKNVLGNALGRELIRFDWMEEKWNLTFQHDIPFDDGSGMYFQNFPDGLNTLAFSFKDKDKWVSDIVLEFAYTKWQSGPEHSRPATDEELERNPDKLEYVLGGCDNYFNNGCYRSGWTYNGKTVGIPLFTPAPADKNGIVNGVCNNRIIAWHLGLGGKIARLIPYSLKMTYSKNFGLYRPNPDQFKNAQRQMSGAFELALPHKVFRHTTGISFGIYADKGGLFKDSAGISVSLKWDNLK